MKQWDVADKAAQRAEQYMLGARPEEAARAEALKAHAAYFQGDMHAALEFIGRSHGHGSKAAQEAAALNIRGMIETALGNYSAAESHLAEAAAIAADFGHALTSYMIEDSRACLAGATGKVSASLTALERLSSDSEYVQEPSLQAYVMCHRGTVMRRAGLLLDSIGPTGVAMKLAPIDRDPYLALNAAANAAYTEGLLSNDRGQQLLAISEYAAARRLRFVELKALLFAAVLFRLGGDKRQSFDILERCLPLQMQLGHVNLVAQELCLQPELAIEVMRRHSGRDLGPGILAAMAHSWRFDDVKRVLRLNSPSYVRTWIERLDSEGSTIPSRAGLLSRQPVGTRRSPRTDTFGDLTTRELEVLELAAKNCSNRDIAKELYISLPTVKTHMTHILRKLGQKSRVGAILEYQRRLGSSDRLGSDS
jgi:DNA-binding CsgD family transcriptional regulator